MIYFARYYRVFKAIHASAKQEWSAGNGLEPRSSTLGDRTPEGRRWDPPYTPQEQPSEPSNHPTGN